MLEEKRELPPFCFACDAEGNVWQRKEKLVEQIYKRETFWIEGLVFECKHCGFFFARGEDLEKLVHATWKEYRKKNKIKSKSKA